MAITSSNWLIFGKAGGRVRGPRSRRSGDRGTQPSELARSGGRTRAGHQVMEPTCSNNAVKKLPGPDRQSCHVAGDANGEGLWSRSADGELDDRRRAGPRGAFEKVRPRGRDHREVERGGRVSGLYISRENRRGQGWPAIWGAGEWEKKRGDEDLLFNLCRLATPDGAEPGGGRRPTIGGSGRPGRQRRWKAGNRRAPEGDAKRRWPNGRSLRAGECRRCGIVLGSTTTGGGDQPFWPWTCDSGGLRSRDATGGRLRVRIPRAPVPTHPERPSSSPQAGGDKALTG